MATKSKEENKLGADGFLKDKPSGKLMHLTNKQRCVWFAPLQLLGTRTYVTSSIVNPGQSIKVDVGRYDAQMAGSRAFNYLVQKGLIVAKNVKNVDPRDLGSVEPVKAPPELTGKTQEGKEHMKVVSQAVTLDVTPVKD